MRSFVCSLLLVCSAQADWLEAQRGAPPVTHFPLETIGFARDAMVTTEDHLGRLVVGGDGMAIFDGSAWVRYPFGQGYEVLRAVDMAEDGRIYGVGLREVGYYEPSAHGEYIYRSLSAHLPGDERSRGIFWTCMVDRDRVYFFAQNQLLCWDGTSFKTWDFPGSSRLYAVRSQRAIWFTHQESGLYRLGPEGPERVFTREQLPDRPATWLRERTDGEGVEIITREGFWQLGETKQQRWPRETVEFLADHPLTDVDELPGGGWLITTLGALGVVGRDGRLLHQYVADGGLPVAECFETRLDRRGNVWIAAGPGGLMQLAAGGFESIFDFGRGVRNPVVKQFTVSGGAVYAATEDGLFQLSGEEKEFREIAGPKGLYSLAISPLGTLVGRFREVVLLGAENRVIHQRNAATFYEVVPSKRRAGVVYLQDNGKLVELTLADGAWQAAEVTVPEYTTQLLEDSAGRVWAALSTRGVACIDPVTRQTTVIPLEGAAEESRFTTITTAASTVLACIGPRLYGIEPASGEPRLLARLPIDEAVRIAANEAGTEVFVLFQRQPPTGRRVFGWGKVRVERDGTARWQEYSSPGLTALGTPGALALQETGTGAVLWVGGSHGALRIRPELAPALTAPETPRLVLLPSAGRVEKNGTPEFTHADHRIRFAISSPEINRRHRLWFQTRLGDERAPWSSPTQTAEHEFVQLGEGAYQFSVRAVDASGLTSPPTHFSFQVLPPWWRSGWAYAGYAVLTVGGIVLAVRLREARTRQRTRELEQLVEQRTAELKKANAAKDEFLSSISHEIRNPLNGVVGLAAGIDTSRLDAVSNVRFQHLRHCADHLSGMMEELLDFSKLEAGTLTLRQETFNLHELVQSLSSLVASEAAKVGLPVDIAISPGVPTWVEGDPSRIRQILLNFVLNALRYAGRAEVLLTVWCSRNHPDRPEITFAVTDEGPGIAPEEQAKLFTRFTRGAAAKANRVAGSGIGLSVCRALAERMHGRVWVESEVGKGSVFSFAVCLPVRSAPVLRAGAMRGDLRTALVVDDEEYNLFALSGLLEPLGFEVTLAPDGKSALAAAQARRFDVVFLDFDLPDTHGPDLCRQLRARPEYAAPLPIFASTAFVTGDKHQQCLDAGMTGVITKPITREKLAGALARISDAFRSAPAAVFAAQPPDALDVFRRLAQAHQTTVAAQLAEFARELESEIAATEGHLQSRNPALAAPALHKLVGRFAFTQAHEAEALAREIEKALVNGDWDAAGRLWPALRELAPRVVENLTATARERA